MHVSSVVEKQGYVQILISGAYSADDLGSVFQSVQAALQRPGASPALLLDSREVSGPVPTTLERYEISMRALDLPKGVRIAMLPRLDVIDPQRFGESVARNRGLAFSVFSDESAAVAWLLGKP